MSVEHNHNHKGAGADIKADGVPHIVRHQLYRVLVSDNSLYPIRKVHLYNGKDGI